MDVLFTGHSALHFLAFRPLFERLDASPTTRVFVSGGRRSTFRGQSSYNAEALYRPLGVDRERVLSVRAIRHRAFDLHLSAVPGEISPGSAGTSVQLFLGPWSGEGELGRRGLARADYYFIVGPHQRHRLDALGLLASDDPRGINVGSPRTDRLRRAGTDRVRVCARYGLDAAMPLILYAPSGGRPDSLDLDGREAVQRLCTTGRYNVLVRHEEEFLPGSPSWSARLDGCESQRLRIARDLDLTPLLAAADLLITDGPTLAAEFSLLDRPILFLSRPEAHGGRGRLRLVRPTGRDHWSWQAGPLIGDPRQIVQAVEGSLRAPLAYTDERHEMSNRLFYNPGGATAAALSFIQRQLQGDDDRHPVPSTPHLEWGLPSGLGTAAGR